MELWYSILLLPNPKAEANMLVSVDDVVIDPGCLRAAEKGFNQKRFRGEHTVMARLEDHELLTLIADDYEELSRELRADVAKVGANELQWLQDISFPPLVDVMRAEPERLCDVLLTYYGDSIWTMLSADRVPGKYLVTGIDSVTRKGGGYQFQGTASVMKTPPVHTR